MNWQTRVRMQDTYHYKYKYNYGIFWNHGIFIMSYLFVENVRPANSALFFTFRPIASKQLNSLTKTDNLSWLHWWCLGNASAWLQSWGPGFKSRLRQGFYVCLFFVLLLLCFYLFVQKHIICHKMFNVNLFSKLNILQDWWPIIRV